MEDKVGIITFHMALNYGAVLQAYALQSFLSNLGIKNEIIDYKCQYIEKCYKPFFISKRKILNSIIRGILFGGVIREKDRVFKKFVKEKLITSQKFNSIGEMAKLKDRYSYFITGSDQVWSPISAGFDEAYFLPFAGENQKYSYAASIGTTELSDEQIAKYKSRLSGFVLISVREQSAYKLLKKIDANKQTRVHVDPTLLLKKSDWMNLADSSVLDEPYLLIFNVEKCIHDLSFAKKIAKEKHLKLVYINERTIIRDKDIKYFQAPEPELFLSLFIYASAVVTNSFHGTVFSIIFQKDFYVELNNKKQRNIRVEALLDMVGIRNRTIRETYATDSFDEVDWSIVENILEQQRQESRHYLCEINARHF